MRVTDKESESSSGHDLLFRVAKEKRGEIMPKSKTRGEKVMASKAHSDGVCKQEHAFVAVDGASYKSLRELADGLERMSDDTFYYHVNDSKNDFGNWVKGVFHEDELAAQIQRARTKEKTQIVVLRHLLANA